MMFWFIMPMSPTLLSLFGIAISCFGDGFQKSDEDEFGWTIPYSFYGAGISI